MIFRLVVMALWVLTGLAYWLLLRWASRLPDVSPDVKGVRDHRDRAALR